MLSDLSPGRVIAAGTLAMAASVGAAAESIPVGHFAAAITALLAVHKVGVAAWRAWRGAEAWLDARIASAVKAGTSESIGRLERRFGDLACLRVGLCDDTGEIGQMLRMRSTPLPHRHED